MHISTATTLKLHKAHAMLKKSGRYINRYMISLLLAILPLSINTPSTLSEQFELFFFVWSVTLVVIAMIFGFGPAIAATVFSASIYYSLHFIEETLTTFQAAWQASYLLGFGLIVGALRYIEQRQTHAMTVRAQYFRALTEQSPNPIILKDEHDVIRYVSASIGGLLQYKDHELYGKDFAELIHPDDQKLHRAFYRTAVRAAGKRMNMELRMRRKDGTWIWVKNDLINMLNDDTIQSIVGSLYDISPMKLLDEERARILEREKKARSDAEQAVRARDEFLSIASHELKTPLTTILLQLQATLRRILTQSLVRFSGEKLLKSLTIAEQQSQQLESLIKDLLNVSLISTGRITLKKQPVDIAETVHSLVERFQEQAIQTGSQLRVEGATSLRGECDVVRFEQCIANLITNALKYGKEKPVVVTLTSVDGEARITVADEGIGIKDAHQEDIFEPFRRGSNTNGVKGLGVGLFIARQIARAHGGDIRLESHEGKGSKFTVHLPLGLS